MKMTKTDFQMVGEFHEKFGLPNVPKTKLNILDDDLFLYRLGFLHEELVELLQSHRDGDMERIADGLADLVYVALGTAHLYGIPFDQVFAEVHRANMGKERATDKVDGRSTRRHALDVVKPAGWTPPDVGGVIEKHRTMHG